MNPWDIAAWAGAITVTVLCIAVTISFVTSIVKKFKDSSR